MAATRLIPMHVNRGKTAAASMKERIDYAHNPDKTDNGELVTSYIDRKHVHNHVIFSAVDLKAERKFRNFFLSAYALRRLSDMICVEHGLSIIEEKPKREWQSFSKRRKEMTGHEILRMDLDEILEKKPESFDVLLRYLQEAGYEIKHGKHVSVRSKKGYGFIRFRSLGEGYTETDLRAVIEGKQVRINRSKSESESHPHTFSLMKDFDEILRQKKGKGYERWAMHFNNTQAAEVLIFLQENNIDSYEKLDALANDASDRFHVLSEEIRACETRLKEIGNMKKAITDYSKTRGVYEAYRKAGYSKKFFEEHRAELTIHKAAKNVALLLGRESVPERNAQPSRET